MVDGLGSGDGLTAGSATAYHLRMTDTTGNTKAIRSLVAGLQPKDAGQETYADEILDALADLRTLKIEVDEATTQMLVAAWEEGITQTDMADALGVTKQTVFMLLQRRLRYSGQRPVSEDQGDLFEHVGPGACGELPAPATCPSSPSGT